MTSRRYRYGNIQGRIFCSLILLIYTLASGSLAHSQTEPVVPTFNYFKSSPSTQMQQYLREKSINGEVPSRLRIRPADRPSIAAAPVAVAAPVPTPPEEKPTPIAKIPYAAAAPMAAPLPQLPDTLMPAAGNIKGDSPPQLFPMPQKSQQSTGQKLEIARVNTEFQCDLLSDENPLQTLDQSLDEMVSVFKAEPECRAYTQQVEQVDQNATNLAKIYESAKQTLVSGVHSTDQINNAQNLALQLLQGARQNIDTLVPSLSAECRAKLYTRGHLIKGISDFTLNITPLILRLASVHPTTQAAASIITGATTMVASVTSQLADEQIQNSVDMSVRSNRFNLAQNVCQYYKISKRFKTLSLSETEDLPELERSLNNYIQQYLKQSTKLDPVLAGRLGDFWNLYQSTFTVPAQLKESQFISNANMFLPIRDLAKITTGNQCMMLVRSKLNRAKHEELDLFQSSFTTTQTTLDVLDQDVSDFTDSFPENKMDSLITQLEQELEKAKSLRGAEQLTQCKAIVSQFTSEWKQSVDELVGYIEIARAILRDNLEQDPQLKAHYEHMERFRLQVSSIEDEKKIAFQVKTPALIFARSEINAKINLLRNKLLSRYFKMLWISDQEAAAS